MKFVRSLFRESPVLWSSAVVLIVLLLAKFCVPLLRFAVPLGYDPGIYRFLFLEYADALRSFSLPELLPWAKEYPPALYIAGAPLVLAGVPVDALIGWLWNLVPVVLSILLSVVTGMRTTTRIGVVTLGVALLSQPYFDGFYAMYIKVYVSLIFLLLTYVLVEKMSFWFPVTALLTVVIHQQTGLVLVVALAAWWLMQLPRRWQSTRYRTLTIALALVATVGLLYYLPNWERAIWSPLKSIILLRGDNAPAGSFPDYDFYLRTMPALLLLGVGGFLLSFKHERGSLWQLSVLIPLIFIGFRLVFYRRFFLLFDFFLMPYAAILLVAIWDALRDKRLLQILLGVVVVAQAISSFRVYNVRQPTIRASDIERIETVAHFLPKNASIIAMENISGTWLRGWAPDQRIGAPGLFDYPGWSYEQWEQFIDGSNAERKALLETLEGDVYFLLTPTFTGYYGERANAVLRDPCLVALSGAPVLLSQCSK